MKHKALFFGLLLLFWGQLVAQESVSLWEGYDVNHGKQVTLTPYLAENNESGMAIIVCPGGSYCWLDIETEGDGVAQWLQSNGISAFVLRYRAVGFGAYFWHPCFSDVDFLKDNGIDTKVSLKPTFVAPIYPVVTMQEPYVHKRSRRALLSEQYHHNPTMKDSLSLERHIPADCPPVFLVNCVDDPIVEYHNSMLLDSALTANHVNHRYIQYQTGGHGFGASEEKGTEECRQWKNEFLNWIKGQGF